MAPADPGAGGYAATSFPPGRPILTGLIDLNSRIRREFTFRAGVTTISTPVARVLAQRAGVCQDFTHLMIAALRAHGLPCLLYTSGPRGCFTQRFSIRPALISPMHCAG